MLTYIVKSHFHLIPEKEVGMLRKYISRNICS